MLYIMYLARYHW